MLSTILVPLDGSTLAEQALPFAERIARTAKARLILARVVPAHSAVQTSIEPRPAHEYLEELASRLRRADIAVEVVVVQGDAAAQIGDVVEAHGADVVVMSTHGRSGIDRWVHGSVADAVIRWVRVPVMLIPPDERGHWPTDRRLRILVPLDESPLAEAVLGPAAVLATALAAELLLIEAVAWPPVLYSDPAELLAYELEAQVAAARRYLADLAVRLRERGISARWRIEVGRTPVATIVQLAHDEQADLIAMATHGRSGLTRVVLGSTTTGTVQNAGVPLLIVRPTGLATAQSSLHDSLARA